MVPTKFIVLRDMPRTPNLKIDRAALASAPRVADSSASAPAAERTGTSATGTAVRPARAGTARPAVQASPEAVRHLERAVSEIWESVLRLPVTGVHDNFFDLGGHSLLVVQVHQKLQALIGHSFPVTDLFRFATVHTIAVHLAPLAARLDTPVSAASAPAAAAAATPVVEPAAGDHSVPGSAEGRAARRLAAVQSRIGRRG
jgi:hypothetical protein